MDKIIESAKEMAAEFVREFGAAWDDETDGDWDSEAFQSAGLPADSFKEWKEAFVSATKAPAEIEIEQDGATGPRAVYPAEAAPERVESAALAHGLVPSFDDEIKLSTTRGGGDCPVASLPARRDLNLLICDV